MKTISIFIFLVVVGASILLSSCSGGKKDEASVHDEASSGDADEAVSSIPQFSVDATFQEQLGNLFTNYISLKEAFVTSDATKVKVEAATTHKALGTIDMKLLSGAAHNDWMNYSMNMNTAIDDIKKTDDIEAQREAFSTLSDNLYKSIKAFGMQGAKAYYQFCPMAFNDEGGYWLSDQEKIRNPYFGDRMLSCGTVEETLQYN